MKEEKKDMCLRMLRKLRKRMLPYEVMSDNAEWVNGLVIKLHDEDKDYDLPREIKIECNKLWNECIMRDNY